ncbi:MAG: 2-aminoethylphosphonate--pyruvate transaminase [Alphaproteobacteria bacterium GM202ARS2]|nr:2-aminoethylphosphonate--pyruvate transaminase [Alphaproteobacteria bacterium GM202ARS2]
MWQCLRHFLRPRTPLLLTPGPLSTSPYVRAKMRVDYPSRDATFSALTTRIITDVRALVNGNDKTVVALLPGSGTYAIEAMLRSSVATNDHVLIIDNGAYGARIADIAAQAQLAHTRQKHDPYVSLDLSAIEEALKSNKAITHIAMTYCETSSGMLNPYESVLQLGCRYGKTLLVDAMSAFGALPLSLPRGTHAGRLVIAASANKCLEGAPGLAFVIANPQALQATSTSLSLDVQAQYAFMQKTQQFRFTPPVQVVAACAEALRRHKAEGGVDARHKRYQKNAHILIDGMQNLGFATVLQDKDLSPIIVSFHRPPALDFQAFYHALWKRGFAIYPGKLLDIDSFRVGCIGHVFPRDMHRFLRAVKASRKALAKKP